MLSKKISAKTIRLFHAALLIIIIVGYQLIGDDFYLAPSLGAGGSIHGKWTSMLSSLREQLVRSLNNSMTEPHSSLAAGIILGARENLPKSVTENFRKTGTSHLVAVSGYNVTVVAEAFSWLFIKLGFSRRKAFWLVIIALINFAVLAGAQAAVVRAAIMGILVLAARHLGRPSRVGITLTWAALLMLIINPGLWKNDIGFQLSFMATWGLVCFSSRIQKIMPKILPQILRENFSSTLAATICTSPLIIYHFGRFSVASLLANLLALPAIPWLMLAGSFAMIGGLVNPWLGRLPGLAAILISSYVLKVLQFFARLPGSEINI